MPEERYATLDDHNEAVQRIIVLETQLNHTKETIQAQWTKMDTLEKTVRDGFATLNDRLGVLGNWRSIIVAGGSSLGGGIAVGFYALLHARGLL